MATYKTLAIVDDVNTCDCCGKTGLKMTVAMERDDGEILHFGSVCATRHSGRDSKAIKSEAKVAHEAKVAAARKEMKDSAEEAACQSRMNEAHAKGIKIGREFRAFCFDAIETADAKRRAIATKYSLDFYAF